MANQYTKAEEEGREKPVGQNLFTQGKKKGLDAYEKAKIRAGIAADKLERFLNGELDMSPAQVSAAKVLIDKGLPSLQAIETKEVNDWERMTEDEMMEMVNALITANPGLIQRLGIGLRPVDAAPQEGNEAKVA